MSDMHAVTQCKPDSLHGSLKGPAMLHNVEGAKAGETSRAHAATSSCRAMSLHDSIKASAMMCSINLKQYYNQVR